MTIKSGPEGEILWGRLSFRGLGKPANPFGLGPKDRWLKSSIPDQSLAAQLHESVASSLTTKCRFCAGVV